MILPWIYNYPLPLGKELPDANRVMQFLLFNTTKQYHQFRKSSYQHYQYILIHQTDPFDEYVVQVYAFDVQSNELDLNLLLELTKQRKTNLDLKKKTNNQLDSSK